MSDTLRLPKCPDTGTIWCGPYIVALLLGIDYDEAYKALLADARKAAAEAVRVDADRDQRIPSPIELKRAKPVSVTGTYPHQVARLLNKRGVRCDLVDARADNPRLTVQSLVRHIAKPNRTYLIDAADHWLVVRDGVMYNSHFEPVLVSMAPRYRLARVLWWAEVPI